MKNKKLHSYLRNPILIVIICVIVVAGTGFALHGRKNKENVTPDETPVAQQTPETINFDPPTEEEKNQSEQHKQELIRQSQLGQTQPAPPKSVIPIITDASQYNDNIEVRAYVSGIIESGGKCNLTFTQGTQQLLRTVDGLPDAKVTRCNPAVIPKSTFPALGQWTLIISYSSQQSSGVSDPWQLEIK